MFQTPEVYLFRKPAGIPTSRGKETCFLDLFAEGSLDMDRGIVDFPHFIEAFEQIRTIEGYMLGNKSEARQWLLNEFSVQEEHGLINRLDTDTSGMLYFARSREIYKQRHDWQRAGKVQKWYLAQVEGDVRRDALHASEIDRDAYYASVQGEGLALRFPMMHHVQDPERMVSCVNEAGLERMMRRGRGKVLEAESWITSLSYDSHSNTSIVRVMINHGWRHQIRVHLSMLGNPIIGDALYGSRREELGKDTCKASVPLQLVSCGCRVERR